LPAIEVRLVNDPVWLTQKQIAEVFGTRVPTISKHISNIFKSGELDMSTVSILETVQKEGGREIKRTLDVFSLDMILSIGYKVNSIKATQFRIWANGILNEYLIKGYSVNEERLRVQIDQLASLKSAVNLLSNVLESKELTSDEATGLLKVVTDYAYALDILDKYDHQQLTIEGTTNDNGLFRATYGEAVEAINTLHFS